MKKVLILSAMCALCLSTSAKTLKVYSVNGSVTKKDGTTWTKLEKQAYVSDSETIKINPISSLRVLDPATRQIYTFSSEGTYTVSVLLKQAFQENSSLGSKIAAESRRQADLATTKSHKAVSAAKRATLDEEQQEALYTTLVNGFEAGINKGTLHVSKLPTEDGLIYLSLTNTGDTPIYVNVFTRSEDGHWTAIYEFDTENPALLISPGKNIPMTHTLLSDEADATFVAVGFPEAFDGAELTDMFTEEFEPRETTADNVSLFFLK
ncbi:MAG: hypothetical protein K2N48_08965 [Muribaculaceae bacterium]|nr:hypothetical protein [Muribaculaceae bacterium]